MNRLLSGAGFVAALCIFPALAPASTFSFNGLFLQDDQLESFSFATTGSAVTVRSFGYAGGTNGKGMVIPSGGFDTNFSVFDATGTLVAQNNDGTGVPVDPSTGNAFDALINQVFAAGTYRLVLTQNDNLAAGTQLSDGFTQAGNGNFTCPEFMGTSGAFCDATPSQRNGKWAIDISGVTRAVDLSASTAAPEPASLFLVSSVTLIVLARRRRTAQK